MKFSSSLVAWLLLGAAFLAWIGVVYFSLSIQSMADSVAQTESDASTASQRASIAEREHALALGSAAERSELEGALQNDPLTLTSVIAKAGNGANVSLHVSDASSEGLVGSTPNFNISAIGFTVEGNGSFQSLMHAAQLLESLQLPSSIEELDFSRTPGASSGAWHMSAHIQVFTSLPIGS